MRIAVVGAGIFGCTVAIHAARAGHEVELFDRKAGVLQCASGVNQFRLHCGYHYPRSPETVQECQAGLDSFRNEYGAAIVDGGKQIYAIARKDMGSSLTGAEYRRFCDRNNLPYRLIGLSSFLDPEMVDLAVQVVEGRISLAKLRLMVEEKLVLNLVSVHLCTSAPATLKQDFDIIVVAAYAGTNAVTDMLGCKPQVYQFEVCEKPVVKMPKGFPGIVVMDGEFGCVDPWDSKLYLLGHVKHAIHSMNVGLSPYIPEHLKGYLDNGVVTKPSPATRFNEMIASGMEFIPGLIDAEYFGSMFTVRAVLADVEHTDERPTLVEELDDQVIRIFSGKIGTAVLAAEQVMRILSKREDRMAA